MRISTTTPDLAQPNKAARGLNPEVTKADLRAALNAEVRASLCPITAGLSALYVFLAVGHALVLPGTVAVPMISVALVTAVALLGLYFALRHWSVPLNWAHPVGASVAGLILLNSLLHLYLIPEPQQTTNVALLVIGVGCFFLSARWLALVITAALIGWLSIVLAVVPSPAWLHYGFMLLISIGLSALVHTVRVRTICQLKRMHIQDERRKSELEWELTERRRVEEALRESEKRYRDLVEHSLGLICAHDLDGRLLSVNPTAAHTLGYEPAEMVGRSLREFLAPSVQRLLNDYLERIRQKQTVSGLMRVMTKGGEERIWSFRNLRYEEAGKAPYVLGHAQDVTEQKQAQEELHTFSRRLIEAQEAERRRIARDLHDQIGQALVGVEISLQTAKLSPEGSTLSPQLDESISMVDAALQQVHTLSHDLRPSLLDDLGLVAALRSFADQQARRAGFVVEFIADPPPTRPTPEIETVCFRIAQEALTNVVRHAQAHRVWVVLKQYEGELHLAIRDDGVGFDMRAVRKRFAHGEGLGLQGIQERALGVGGRVEIESRSNNGTEIRAHFPLTSYSSGREDAVE